MAEAKVAQRIVTHNTTIMALANESSWREALAVLEGMQQQTPGRKSGIVV
jgi:pentatricopeptide repeat protein